MLELLLFVTSGSEQPPIGKFLVFAYYTVLIFPCLQQIGEAWPMINDARAALLLSLTLSPALASYFLVGGQEGDTRLIAFLKRRYVALLERADGNFERAQRAAGAGLEEVEHLLVNHAEAMG